MRWHTARRFLSVESPPGGQMLRKLVPRAGARRHRALLLLVALAAFVGPSTSAGADATVRLSNDVVHHLDAATLLGPVPAMQQISVGISLRNPNEAAEDAYLQALYDPTSSSYQQ